MSLNNTGVTDYLDSKFPAFELTKDTVVKPFKYYYSKKDGKLSRIVDPDRSSNPSELHWYEATRKHHKEFQHNCDSVKVNNIGVLSQYLISWLVGKNCNPGFPEENLPREIEGVDWSLNFNDTKFDEIVGSTPVPLFAVSFDTNMRVASSIPFALVGIVAHMSELKYTTGWDKVHSVFDPRSIVNGHTDIEQHGPTYSQLGYKFIRSTVSNLDREYDVFSLAAVWTSINVRQAIVLLKDAYEYLESLHAAAYIETSVFYAWQKFIELIDQSARTVAHIAKLVGSTVIVDAEKFEDKLLSNVPSVIEHEGTLMYKLEFVSQLVSGAKYGQLASDWNGNVELIDVNQVFDPVIRFAGLQLYATGKPSVNYTVPYHYVQNGNVWYTSVVPPT